MFKNPFKSKSEILDIYLKENFNVIAEFENWWCINKTIDTECLSLSINLNSNGDISINYYSSYFKVISLEFKDLERLESITSWIFHEMLMYKKILIQQEESNNKIIQNFISNQLPEEELNEILQDVKDVCINDPQVITGIEKENPYYQIIFDFPKKVTKLSLGEFSELFRSLNQAILRIESEYDVDVEWCHEESKLILRSNLKTQLI